MNKLQQTNYFNRYESKHSDKQDNESIQYKVNIIKNKWVNKYVI